MFWALFVPTPSRFPRRVFYNGAHQGGWLFVTQWAKVVGKAPLKDLPEVSR
jgi:hypothetical protein